MPKFTKKDAQEYILLVAKNWDVEIVFKKTKKYGGYWCSNHICISTYFDFNYMLTSFFHELGHEYCYKKGFFKKYHHNDTTNIEKYIKVANKAELFVDKWGERHFKKCFPHLHYKSAYRKRIDLAWLRVFILTQK